MLILAISGVLVGFAFLVVSFVTENSTWAWGCIAACVAAALILFIDARSRRPGRPLASPDAVEVPVQRVDPVADGGVPIDVSASGVGTTTAGAVLEVRTGRPTVLRTDLPALEEVPVEPDLLPAAGGPEHPPEPVTVPTLVTAPEPEPRPEAAPVLVAPEHFHDEAPVPPVATATATDEQEADAAAPVAAGLEHDVLVVDEHPRFHLPGCTWLVGRETMSLPAREAVELGFTPCPRCSPDRTLASPVRA